MKKLFFLIVFLPASLCYSQEGDKTGTIKVKKEQIDTVPTAYTFSDPMPKYPGGEQAMMKYLQKNINYPALAKDKSIVGKVFVSFIVEVDGSVVEAGFMGETRFPEYEKEIIKVFQAMPKWTPGLLEGKPVAVLFNVPIEILLK